MAIKFLNTATAATQAVGDNSTKIATTAYADAAAAAVPIGNYLPLSAGSSYPLTGTLHGTSTNFSGSGDYAGSMTLGTGASTAEAHLTIGQGRTGNGYSYIDLVGDATYTDYGFRMIRGNGGANTTSELVHRGTGNFSLVSSDGGDIVLIPNAGNVGIGTTGPSAKLDVNGSLNVSGAVTIASPLGVGSVANALASASGALHLAGSKMTILSTGNVGIGTTSPFSKLQVGSSTFTGANGMFANSRVGISNHGSLTGMMLASTYNDSTYPEYGLVFVQGASTSSYNVWSISPDGPAKGSGLSFIYKADATNIHNQTPQVYFEGSTGNVGIGTTSPTAKLHVTGTGLFTGLVSGITPVAAANFVTKAYADAGNARVTPATPSTITSTIVGETIEIAFNQSSTSNIDYYQVWSSDDGGDYGIIAQITPADFSSTMTVVDTTFVTGGTMSYRVFAVREGIYSTAGTTSKAYTVAALSVTDMTVVNLNTAYYIQYEKPTSRFIDHVEIYMDSQTTSAALSRSNATIVYSGQNASYMRNVNTSSNFHQFWVEIVTS